MPGRSGIGKNALPPLVQVNKLMRKDLIKVIIEQMIKVQGDFEN